MSEQAGRCIADDGDRWGRGEGEEVAVTGKV